MFRRFSEQAHYRTAHSTRQGIYALAPNGKLLGSLNSRNPEAIARMLRDALATWKGLAPAVRRLDDETRDALRAMWRWDDEYPADGLVLEITSRDLPRDENTEREGRRRRGRGWWKDAWNRDWAWFRAEEAAEWVPEEPVEGGTFDVPYKLMLRLAEYHFIDNVRGQVDPFDKDGQVRLAEMRGTVTACDADTIEVSYAGKTDAAVEGGDWPRSMRTTLTGSGTWDRKAQRFSAFELVAVGERMGGARFNERLRDPGPAPVGYVLRLAPENAPRVAPAFIWRYGWRPTAR